MSEPLIESLAERPRACVVRELPTQVLTEQYNRWSVDLAASVGEHDLVWADPDGPSADWTLGAMLGNGDMGAAVYGYPDNYTLVLGKTDLWDRRDPGRGFLPDCTLADIRRCYDEQDEQEYRRLADTLPDHRLPSLIPAGVLRLRVAEAAIHSACAQRLYLYNAVSETSFLPAGQYGQTQQSKGESTVLRALVSQPHEVLALRFLPGAYQLGPLGLEFSRSPEPDVDAPTVHTDGDTALVHYRLPAGDSYVVGVWCSAAVQWHQANHRLIGDMDVSAGEFVLYLALVTEADSTDVCATARARLDGARAAGIDAVETAHRDGWAGYWRRGYAAIDDPEAERGWYRALYLCASCLRAGRFSPGLQGAWIKEHHPAWRADYHANLNIQATYWSCFGANRLDLVEPLLAFYLSILPRCRRDTREFFGMEGSYLPHACDLFGSPVGNTKVLTLLSSMTPSCWLASMFWDYFTYSQDRDYLERAGYPLLREVARFAEDYVVFEEDRITISPSICWEVNTGLAGFEGWGVNSQYDLAALRRLWQVSAWAADALGVDEADASHWEQLLRQLPDFPVDSESGAWKAFADKPPIFKNAHGPWLTCPVFPFEQLSLFHGSRHWYSHAMAALEEERRHGISFFDQESDWCGYFTANAVRLGFPSEALRLAGADRRPTLGLRRSWDNPKFMVDHAPGMGRALNDMLLLSLGGVIHLFPGVPATTSARFHSLRTEGAFLVSAEKRGTEIVYAIIESLAGSRLRIACPFGDGASVAVRLRCLEDDSILVEGEFRRFNDSEAREVDLAADTSGRWVLETETRTGAVYVLERRAVPLEAIPRAQPAPADGPDPGGNNVQTSQGV